MSARVLIVCYYFPPMGLAGVRRPLALFKKLSAYGYDADILTVKPVTYFVYEPELLEGLDLSRVHRSGSADPQRIMWLLGKRTVTPSVSTTARRVLTRVFPDSKRGWVRPATKLGRTLVENYRYRAIISTSPPISAHLVAMTLAREFKLPWIADFRDFWTMERIEDQYDSPRLIKKGEAMLNRIREAATEITGVNELIVEYLGKGEMIRNGFDLDRAKLWSDTPDSDRFVIGVSGNEVEKGNLQSLWNLLRELTKLNPLLLKRLTLVKAGLGNEESFRAQAHGLSPDIKVEFLGYLKGEEYLKQLSRASVLYIGLTDDMGDSILPSRIFELLASGRSILASCRPESELAGLIKDNRCGISFTDQTADQGARELMSLMQLHETNQLTIKPLPEFIRDYSTDKMTKRFAIILDRIV